MQRFPGIEKSLAIVSPSFRFLSLAFACLTLSCLSKALLWPPIFCSLLQMMTAASKKKQTICFRAALENGRVNTFLEEDYSTSGTSEVFTACF